MAGLPRIPAGTVSRETIGQRLNSLGRRAKRLPTAKAVISQADFPIRAPSVPGTVEKPKQKSKTGESFETDWARSQPARVARMVFQETVMAPVVRFFADPEVHGTDRFQDLEGPAVFAANHASHLDTLLLLRTIPEPRRHKTFAAAAADYFFDNRVKGVASALGMNAIPIDRNRATRSSIRRASELIADGWSMIIYPEGGRSPDGWAREFRAGAAYIAIRTGTPVIPIHIEGTARIIGKGTLVPKPGKVTATFGAPMWASEGETPQSMAVRIEHAVATLADEASTDWWQARRRAHALTTPSLRGPGVGDWRRSWAKSATEPEQTKTERAWPKL